MRAWTRGASRWMAVIEAGVGVGSSSARAPRDLGREPARRRPSPAAVAQGRRALGADSAA